MVNINSFKWTDRIEKQQKFNIEYLQKCKLSQKYQHQKRTKNSISAFDFSQKGQETQKKPINQFIAPTITPRQPMPLNNFQHIQIPYDQLQLFHQPQKNEMFLIETLLFSTKINLHVHKHVYSSILIITKHNIWFKDERKKKNIFALPVKALLFVIKAQQFPELVFVTDQPYDNVRISVSNEERCNSIISGISYLFSKILKDHQPLKIYFANEPQLKNYQKTWQQKNKENFTQSITKKYPNRQIVYKQAGKQQIYGYLNLQNKRVCMMKQIYNSHNHMIHVAKVISSHNHHEGQSEGKQGVDEIREHSNGMENYFYLHTIQKTEEIMQALRKYESLPYENLGEELVYVRELDYKIQLFFRYLSQVPKQGSPYYNYQLSPQRLFINLMQFYDIILMQSPQTVLNFSLLCFQTLSNPTIAPPKDKSQNNKRSFRLNEEYNNSFTQITLKLREFRYDFLLTDDNELMRLIYQCYYEKGEFVYDPHSWKTKFYHLALILYEFMYGNEYFSAQLDPETILKMKKSKKVVFPKYLNTESGFLMSWQLQDFMEKAIKLKFKSLEDVFQHPWMKQSVLILAYEHCPRISTKNLDKKTDATKSF